MRRILRFVSFAAATAIRATTHRIAVLDLRAVAVRMATAACTLCLLAATSAFAALTPDLTIAKTHVGNFTQSQIGASYTITVSNLGPGDVQSGNTVTVTETLPPAGLTATSISGSGWSCTEPSGPCSRLGGNAVLAAGTSYPPLTLFVDVANNAPASVTNNVTVSGGGELNTANDSASDPTTIGPGPDLTIAKSHVGNFTQSQIGASYTITVSNLGPGDVQSGNTVTVTETLPPAGLTATSISGSGWSCTEPSGPCSRLGGNAVLAAGTSYPPLTLFVDVANNAPASVTNNVTVSGGGELNTANDSASDPTTIGPGPDLTIAKSHVGNFTQSQIGASYTITVSNLGPGDVQSGNTVTVTETLPPAGLTATSISGSGWSCTEPSGPCSRLGGNAVLAAGTSYPPLTLFVDVANNAPASVTNNVTVSGGGELNTANDSASDPTTIGPGPDLTIAKSHVGNFTQSQIGASYTITVSNLGPGDVQSGNTVTVTETLPPAGLTATSISGSGWSCTEPSGPCSRLGGNAVLAAGTSYPPLTLFVDVANNAPASVTNNVTVSGGGELNTANDSASDPTTIGPGPDLTIAKSHVGNFTQSQIGASYTITVSNLGPGDVQSGNTVTVTETLPPAGLTATSISGSGWSCTEPSGPCSRLGGNAVLAAGTSYPPLTLLVNVAGSAPTSVTNNVTVSGGGELNTTNDAASDPTTISGPAAKLAFTVQPSNANAGAVITPAVGVQVQDAAGIPVTISTAQVDMAIGNNPSGGTLGGTASISASGGIATFSTLSINKGGPGYTLTASSAGLASATSNPFNIIPVPTLVSASSRRTHGAAGSFDLGLSVTAVGVVNHNPATEPRQGPAQTIVFTFDTPVNAATVNVSEGAATAGAPTFNGNDVIVDLTGVTDIQYVTVDLTNVMPTGGGPAGSGEVRVGFLVGDVNQGRTVTVSDLVLVNRQQLVPLTTSNYLNDVNVSGSVTVSDKVIVNRNLLHALPLP